MTDPACRVLVIEDNPSDVRLLERALEKSRMTVDLTVVSDLASGIDAASTGSWDVVLADLTLPDAHGLDAVRQLQAAVPDFPVVVMTMLGCDETALSSLDNGAQDYIVKDQFTPESLERSIRFAMQRHQSTARRRMLDRLQSSERALEKKNRRLSRLYKTAHRFVDNVSHEFRTPLTVINEYVSLMRDGLVGPLNDEQKRMLDVIGDRSEDLNNMVDDMLDISKLEAGMLGVWRQPCRIADIIEHVRPSLVRKSTVQQVELTFDVPDDLPEVYADDEKIGRVIINLAVNAIKFCRQPGRVQVWARHEEQKREVCVGVSDNGDGISSENLALIFQRFKQVGGNPRNSTRGFGLGLSIAKELVHLNMGDINVTSEVGGGSTFRFSLPVAEPLEVMTRYIDRIERGQNGRSSVSLLTATPGGPAGGLLAEDLNTFLNTLLRRHDLIFRLDESLWLIAVPCEKAELHGFVRRAEEARHQVNRNRPGEPLPRVILKHVGTWLLSTGAPDLLDAVARFNRAEALSPC